VFRAPGRVNLIGDHTDYTGGLVLPMAIDRYTTIEAVPQTSAIDLASTSDVNPVHLALPVTSPENVSPPWGRYVAGVAAELGNDCRGFRGTVSTTLPIGSGLSSSAALEVAVALACGAPHEPLALAQLCQRAEQRATGVPCGIMDQLTSVAGVKDHALLIDCHSLEISPVTIPSSARIVVKFIAHRRLASSAYGQRVTECATAERLIGPLRSASLRDVESIADDVILRRARHVVSENERACGALRANDLARFGALMVESHASLRDDYEVSTPEMDAAVEAAIAIPGVYGARLTGGGFGGCIVILASSEAQITVDDTTSWEVRAVDGALFSQKTA
jgi:galactokinase